MSSQLNRIELDEPSTLHGRCTSICATLLPARWRPVRWSSLWWTNFSLLKWSLVTLISHRIMRSKLPIPPSTCRVASRWNWSNLNRCWNGSPTTTRASVLLWKLSLTSPRRAASLCEDLVELEVRFYFWPVFPNLTHTRCAKWCKISRVATGFQYR